MVLHDDVTAYKIRKKGSTVAVIPKELCEKLGIVPGTKLKVWAENKTKKRIIYELYDTN